MLAISNHLERRTKLLVLVGVLVAISGCAQIDATVTIGEEGELDQWEMDVQFSEAAWGVLEFFAESEGYDSVEQLLLEDSTEDDDGEEDDVECTEGTEEVQVDEDERSVHIVCNDPVVRNESAVNIDVAEDGSITYEDVSTSAYEEDLEGAEEMDLNLDEMEFTLTVVFPAEVTSTNAHTVEGNRATWHLTEFQEDSLQAQTASPSGMTGDDDGDTTDDTEDSSEGDGTESGDDSQQDDSGDDGQTDDGSSEMDGEDADSDGEEEGDDGVGASGFTLAGVLAALAALVGFGLRRRQ